MFDPDLLVGRALRL